MSSFHSDAFWKAFEKAGMLATCYFIAPGGSVRKSCKVRWTEADVETLGGQQTKDFEIEYRHADMPNLAEGDVLSIDEPIGCNSDYHVREAPYVHAQDGDDGIYKRAKLTRVKARS